MVAHKVFRHKQLLCQRGPLAPGTASSLAFAQSGYAEKKDFYPHPEASSAVGDMAAG